jgi:hypothetical protein
MTAKDALEIAGGQTEYAWPRLKLNPVKGPVRIIRVGAGVIITNNAPLDPGDRVFSVRPGIW